MFISSSTDRKFGFPLFGYSEQSCFEHSCTDICIAMYFQFSWGHIARNRISESDGLAPFVFVLIEFLLFCLKQNEPNIFFLPTLLSFLLQFFSSLSLPNFLNQRLAFFLSHSLLVILFGLTSYISSTVSKLCSEK